MASLRCRPSGAFYLEFRYGGDHFHRSLETKDPIEANQLKATVERTLMLLKEGLLDLADRVTPDEFGQFLRSGGRRQELPSVVRSPVLVDVCDAYLVSFPAGTKEESTLNTETKHLRHFQRILGARTPIDSVTTQDLERYVMARQRQTGNHGRPISAVTINKELQTFRQLWAYAQEREFATGENPTIRVRKPRRNQKLPFMTWEQIEARIHRGGLSEGQVAELRETLFLREIEIAQFLSHVQEVASGISKYPHLYPMFAFVAYTGARRSEMFRCEVEDVRTNVLIREKKRSRDQRITFREVPLHPNLQSIIEEWLAKHPGGQFLFCKPDGRPLEDWTSRDAFAAATNDSRWTVLRGYHVFRHSFASNLARHGVDQFKIDQFMGHQTEEMRQRYRHLFPEDGEAAIGKLDFSMPIQDVAV